MEYTPQKAIDSIDEVLNSTVYYDESLEYEISSYDFDWLEIANLLLKSKFRKSHIKLKNTNKTIGIVLFASAIWEMIWNCKMLVYSQNSVNIVGKE